MKNIIEEHNKKIIGVPDEDGYGVGNCNCTGGVDECPLGGQCLSKGLVYRATVESTEGEKVYFGQTKNEFKERFNNHESLN